MNITRRESLFAIAGIPILTLGVPSFNKKAYLKNICDKAMAETLEEYRNALDIEKLVAPNFLPSHYILVL